MLLGEALYPLVDEIEPQAAAKITGMLLEMDQGEVLLLIEDAGALRAKVQEALTVLKAAAGEEGN
jgi:polyadenylate-binding protein